MRGAIVFDELIAFLNDVYNSPGSETAMHVLWDLRDADFGTVSADGIKSLMEFVSRRWGTDGANRAAVVVARDLDYEMSRNYQLMMDGATSSAVEVFKDIDSARTWIASAT